MTVRKRASAGRLLASTLVLALVLVACGNGEEDAAPAPEPAPAPTEPAEEPEPADDADCEPVTARLAHHVSAADGFHTGSEAWADAINEATDGRVTIDLFPDSQIGSYTENPENIRQQELEFALVDTSVLGNYYAEGSILDLPFMFESQDEFFTLVDGEFGDYLKARIKEETGIELLAITSSGFRNMFFSGSREVVEPEDLVGAALRVPNAPLYLQIFNLLETVPTVVEAGELYNAMQTGIVEGFEFPLPALVALSLHEVVDTMSVTQHIHTAPKLGAGAWFMESLCEHDANIIRELAISVFQPTARGFYADLFAGIYDTIDDAGIRTIEANIPAFREAVQPIYEDFRTQNGTDLWDRLEAARP